MTRRLVVLDTNVLVSALLNPGRKPSQIIGMALGGDLLACYDGRMMAEYGEVLRRKGHRVKFSPEAAERLLAGIASHGRRVADVPPLPEVSFQRDETDRPFYEVAVHCDALLITGNLKHYPADPRVMPPDVFLARLNATATL